MNIKILFELISAICWIIAYILIITKSIKDKTYGMPFVALSLNLAWEFTFSFIYKPDPINRIVCIIWFLLDCVVAYIFFRYGYKEFKKKYSLKKFSFYILTILSIVFSLIFMYLATPDFALLYNGDIFQSAGFIAYFQNLVMSILFVVMFLERRNLKGQSIYIAIFKWIGTLAVGILKFSKLMPSNPTEIYIILLIQFFDILYIYLLYNFSKSKKYMHIK